MSSPSQKDIFAPRKSAQKDIFAKTAPSKGKGKGSLFRAMNRGKKQEGPRTLRITQKPCPRCGETTTSLTNYSCPRRRFGGWWGQWKDMEPC